MSMNIVLGDGSHSGNNRTESAPKELELPEWITHALDSGTSKSPGTQQRQRQKEREKLNEVFEAVVDSVNSHKEKAVPPFEVNPYAEMSEEELKEVVDDFFQGFSLQNL